jgi:hypothetical protein
MLPVTVQFIVAMLAYAINERMARRVEYLHEEVRVLKAALAVATGTTRIAFTAEQRRRLAVKGKALTPEEREACCQVVRPETILKWFRLLSAKKYDSSEQRRALGRPRKVTAHSSSGWPQRTAGGATPRSETLCVGSGSRSVAAPSQPSSQRPASSRRPNEVANGLGNSS